MNTNFVLRAGMLAILLAVLLTSGWLFLQTPFARRPDPTPPPPAISAPTGEPPAGPLAFQEWVRYRGEAHQLAGCGFFLSLADGRVIAVTTAHSVSQAGPGRPLERIALGTAGQAGFVAEFEHLVGSPGRPLTPDDLAIDYLLLRVEQPIDAALVLVPDPRGAPQPGERVWLASGLDNPRDAPRAREGTVTSASEKAIWVLMDDRFNPSLMSGSPLVSQHTGKAVGMVVAASPRGTRLLLGANPVTSLLRIARSAQEFPHLEELDLAAD